MMPTLSTAVWTTGFSQSFLNQSLLSIYAYNFGFPHPAAIAYGLAGAYSCALFMALGLPAADAYSMMFAVWLALAFWGAYSLGLALGLTEIVALLAAALWLSLPIVYLHATYSMLALGIALLPFYFWMSIRLFYIAQAKRPQTFFYTVLGYSLTCFIAVFMDGYSFMMFAVGSSILATYLFFRVKEKRIYFLKFAFPLHFLAFGLAVLFYILFIGKLSYPLSSLNYFRAYGIDLSFLLRPTRGVYCLWDNLHFSVNRSFSQFFGSQILWETTFSLPFILLGGVAWWKTRKKNILATGLLLMSIFGLWMAMGPSVKINSTKPYPMTRIMPRQWAVMPTGNAPLSKYLPGFQEMRETYRWMGLSLLGLWILQLIFLAQIQKTPHYRCSRTVILLLAMILVNLPHLGATWHRYLQYRKSFYHIDQALIPLLSSDLVKGNRVAFLPYRNDFLINYLSARLQIHAYNMGGDKNLAEARRYWPSVLQRFSPNYVDPFFAYRILLLLAKGQANVVILPYISMFWDAEDWSFPIFRGAVEPVIESLKKQPWVDVQKEKYYAVVKLKPNISLQYRKKLLVYLQQHPFSSAIALKEQNFAENTMTEVGLIKNGQLHSTSRAGILLQGPYTAMGKGRYRFMLYGSASNTSGASIHIRSVAANMIMYNTPCPFRKIKDAKGILTSCELTLNKAVDELEIRILVTKETKIQIKGYKLIRVSPKVPLAYE
ncbi:MAG: hypothetical protein WAL30_03635 [Candidatus Aquirickettsiella sp.]